jgi:hypothetical protein
MMNQNPKQTADQNGKKVDECEQPGESELAPEFATGWRQQAGGQHDPQKKNSKTEQNQ